MRYKEPPLPLKKQYNTYGVFMFMFLLNNKIDLIFTEKSFHLQSKLVLHLSSINKPRTNAYVLNIYKKKKKKKRTNAY